MEAQLIELQATAARDAARHESSLGLLQSHAASLETLHDQALDVQRAQADRRNEKEAELEALRAELETSQGESAQLLEKLEASKAEAAQEEAKALLQGLQRQGEARDNETMMIETARASAAAAGALEA